MHRRTFLHATGAAVGAVARQAMPVLPASDSWTWQRGQTVEVQWSPSGDLRLWGLFTIDLLHVTAPNVVDDLIEIRRVTFDGDIIRLTLPSAPPGSYIVELRPSHFVTCGPAHVDAKVTSTFTTFATSHPVTIVP